MVGYKYKIGDKIITKDGRRGIIVDYQVSIYDNKPIPSYWVLFRKSYYPDMQPRNIWESSIKRKRII